MNILLVYGTYSGSTHLTAVIIKELLEKKGHTIQLSNVFELDPKEFAKFEFVIFGSNTWFEENEQGQMNSGFHELKNRMEKGSLAGKRSAVYALGDANLYTITYCKSTDHLKQMIEEFGGTVVHTPLKVNRFYFNQDLEEKVITLWTEELDQLLRQ